MRYKTWGPDREGGNRTEGNFTEAQLQVSSSNSALYGRREIRVAITLTAVNHHRRRTVGDWANYIKRVMLKSPATLRDPFESMEGINLSYLHIALGDIEET